MVKKEYFIKGIFSIAAAVLFGTATQIALAFTNASPALVFDNTSTYLASVSPTSTGLLLTPLSFNSSPSDMLLLSPNYMQKQGDAVFLTPLSPTPTPTLSPTLTQTPTPTQEPTPTPQKLAAISTPTPTIAPTEAPQQTVLSAQATPGLLNADVLFSMVNNHRTSMGLPPFEKDDRSCSLAAARAPEVDNEIATGTMHAGMYGRNLPYWNTENIISMNSEEAAFNWWINDYIHRKAIEGNYKYSCIACSGRACAEEFTNYQPK